MVLSQFLQLDLLQTDTTKNPTVLFQIHLLVLSTFSNLCFDKLMAQHSVASRMCTPSMRILHEGNSNLVLLDAWQERRTCGSTGARDRWSVGPWRRHLHFRGIIVQWS